MVTILIPVIIISLMGLLFGALLGVASKIFHVETDEKIPEIIEILPGANCGGCGYAGCAQYATEVVKGNANASGCPVGGEKCAKKIAEIIGGDANFVKKVARVNCLGGVHAKDKYIYDGIYDCEAANRLAGGPKECITGCMGLGKCVKACKFDAIHIKNSVAVVDENKCTACGQCVKTCPKNVIQIVPKKKNYTVACSSLETGPVVNKQCSVGCIACKICEKACEFEAIKVENFLAKIDYNKCNNCGNCATVCPRKVILSFE